jgi:hypothetical protein
LHEIVDALLLACVARRDRDDRHKKNETAQQKPPGASPFGIAPDSPVTAAQWK